MTVALSPKSRQSYNEGLPKIGYESLTKSRVRVQNIYGNGYSGSSIKNYYNKSEKGRHFRIKSHQKPVASRYENPSKSSSISSIK